MLKKEEIKKIILTHTRDRVTAFVHENGNELNDCVDGIYKLLDRENYHLYHPLQEKLLELIGKEDIQRWTLRRIGIAIGEPHPQKVKHHLNQLVRWGHVNIVGGKYKLNLMLNKKPEKLQIGEEEFV